MTEHSLVEQVRLLELMLGVAHTAKTAYRCPVELRSWTPLAISELRPHDPRPLVCCQRCFSIGNFRSVRSACPLFGIRRLSAIREQKMYCVYGNSSWYIYDGPLLGGLLLRGSVIGGSTVNSQL